MSTIVASQPVTLDGVFEDPGGPGHEREAGLCSSTGAEGDRFKLDKVMASDALLLGRVTFESFAEAWPSREGEFADKFNGMAKYVVSSTLGEPTRNNSMAIGSLVDEYRLMVFPVILGSGRRLFDDGIDRTELRLSEATPVGPQGVVILTYRPAGRDG